MSSGEHSTVYCQVSPATKSLYLESSSSPERKYGRGKKSNNRKPDRQARPSRYPSRQSAKCSGYGRRAKSWSSPWSSPHPTTLLRPKNAEVKSKNTFLDKTHQWESNNEERKKKPRACRLQACPCFPNTDFQGLCSKHRLPLSTSQEPRYCGSSYQWCHDECTSERGCWECLLEQGPSFSLCQPSEIAHVWEWL